MDVSAPLPARPWLPGFVALALRLAGVTDILRRMVAAHGPRNPAGVPLVKLAWHRIGRAAQRLERIVARLAAGGAPAWTATAGAATGTRAAAATTTATGVRRVRPARHPGDAWRDLRPPSDFGWVARMFEETRQMRGQVEALMAEPEMAALLAADPRAGRVLRPLCHMLGVSAGPAARSAAPRRPRKLRPALPRAAVAVAACPDQARLDALPPGRRWPWVVPARIRRRSEAQGAARALHPGGRDPGGGTPRDGRPAGDR